MNFRRPKMSDRRPPTEMMIEAASVQETVIHEYMGEGPSSAFIVDSVVDGMRRVKM